MGGRRRPVSRPSRRRCFLASSLVEPLTAPCGDVVGCRSARGRAPRCPAGRPSSRASEPALGRTPAALAPRAACADAARAVGVVIGRHRRRRCRPPEPPPRACPRRPGRRPRPRRHRSGWSGGCGCGKTAAGLHPGRRSAASGCPSWLASPSWAPGDSGWPSPSSAPSWSPVRPGRGSAAGGGAVPGRCRRHRRRSLRRRARFRGPSPGPLPGALHRTRCLRAPGAPPGPGFPAGPPRVAPSGAGTPPAAAGTPPRARPGSARRHHVRLPRCHVILCRTARSRASGQSPVRLPGARYRGVPLIGGVPRRARTPHGSTL